MLLEKPTAKIIEKGSDPKEINELDVEKIEITENLGDVCLAPCPRSDHTCLEFGEIDLVCIREYDLTVGKPYTPDEIIQKKHRRAFLKYYSNPARIARIIRDIPKNPRILVSVGGTARLIVAGRSGGE